MYPAINKHIKAHKSISIIAGQYFGLTEPKALRTLYNMFYKYQNAHLYLDKAEKENRVFHPKFLLFRKGNRAVIVSGSANVTSGGMVNNQEASICLRVDSSSEVWEKANAYFTYLTSSENVDIADLLIINRYKQFYQEQHKFRKQQRATPRKKGHQFNFNYKRLKQWLYDYRNEENEAKFKTRLVVYDEARNVLNRIASSADISKSEYKELIDRLVGKAGQKALWSSGSLFRKREGVHQSQNAFRKLVKYIKSEQKGPVDEVFEKGRRLLANIPGAGINYLTEIMMTYQPDRFTNLNSNPITVLKEEAGIVIKLQSNSFSSSDYLEYCLLSKEICLKLGLKNMLELDSFFNEIYWELKEMGKVH